MKKLVAGIVRFQNEVFPKNRHLYEQLAAGQQPETLFIGCADSRVVPNEFTQTKPGELFICRNAGNIVPPWGNAMGGHCRHHRVRRPLPQGEAHRDLRPFRLRSDAGLDES